MTKSLRNFSAATSASFRSVSARSKLAPAVTSSEVSSVAPSGSGKAAHSRVSPSVRAIRAVRLSRRSVRADNHRAQDRPRERGPGRGRGTRPQSRRCAGDRAVLPHRSRHISAKTGLKSFMRPSAPNTATPSLRASSVSPCTWVSALTCGGERIALRGVVVEISDAALADWGSSRRAARVRRADARQSRSVRSPDRRSSCCAFQVRKSTCSGNWRLARNRSRISPSVGRWSRKAGSSDQICRYAAL